LAAEGLRCLAIAEIPNAGTISKINNDNKNEILLDIKKYDAFE
jgi:hypothetical protein